MRLVFMGSPDFSVPALHGLIEAGHEIVAVYTQPPRPAGRGKALRRQPVHEAADELGIPVRTPEKLRHNDEELAFFQSLKADAAIVAAYGLILPEAILKAPRLGCLNIHASLLPRWRGASPIQSAIRAGDAESGVCIMQMDKGLDTGAVLLSEATPITPEDTAGSLHDRLAGIGAQLVVRTLEEQPTAVPQDDSRSCYAPRLERKDGQIDWGRSAVEIERQVRAFIPWPGSYTLLEGQTYRIGAVSLPDEAETAALMASAPAPGTVLDDRLTIACGTGCLRIERIQKPGRAMMDREAFLRGTKLDRGMRLD
ncbi:methionyl-tRNA formyltransferase [Parasaccharibacter apium]|uniref:Methionyl-tRNA formyltransferase n=1 Tax=Parasaccharibacter apium TaxID=1510841 RepID=A0ABX4ZM50_9PROT|nr:methionyl-tRNA formyltransferase [Parasaccharibacter apium]POS63079.1 methionyl-tRNA formyltransferase [Parasaccharibacter apium]POS64225.1 methionyl-tRNA formyltransferase [Parasaccharibacter apium]POS64566.1 methionyl-tRNA formyltransferase [Parasaccharibacter apium]